jgi:transposase InsO family protein
VLHPIIILWPFRGWGLDFIGEVHPSSSKGHRFVLVAMNYFSKWTEVVLLKHMAHKEVITFVQEHIIHQFGIPQTLTTDQGTSFMSHQFKEFAGSLKINLLNSSPYYAQANGQAEASNKSLTRLIKKKIDENPRRWHEVLSKALRAHRTTRHSATKVTPFELVYQQEAMLPVEINVQACKASKQEMLSAEEYVERMMDVIDKVPESRLEALQEIKRGKLKALRAYNKQVKEKSLQVDDLV